MPHQFLAMVVAEVRKVFTRGSGLAALVVALLVPLGTVAVVFGVRNSGFEFNQTDVSELLKPSVVDIAGWALKVRNFFVLPLCLLLAAASSVAGEYGARTLRELAVRPIPRWSILAAKLLALFTLSLATLVLTLLPALALGFAMFGLPEAGGVVSADAPGLADVLLGYLATLASDMGLYALAMLASLFVGSVGGVIVSMTLLLLADFVVGVALKAAGTFGVEAAATLVPWTLGNALACWEGYANGWNAAQFGALGAFTVAASAIAVVRFNRMDVP